MGTIKDRNDRDLVDAEEIKKRWKEYTEKLYKKDPNKPDCWCGQSSRARPSREQSQVGLKKHCC